MRRSDRRLSTEARRMLDMLAAWPQGVLEPMLRAHGFHPKMILALIGAGFATGNFERAIARGRRALVMRVKITHSGRLTREPAAKR